MNVVEESFPSNFYGIFLWNKIFFFLKSLINGQDLFQYIFFLYRNYEFKFKLIKNVGKYTVKKIQSNKNRKRKIERKLNLLKIELNHRRYFNEKINSTATK